MTFLNLIFYLSVAGLWSMTACAEQGDISLGHPSPLVVKPDTDKSAFEQKIRELEIPASTQRLTIPADVLKNKNHTRPKPGSVLSPDQIRNFTDGLLFLLKSKCEKVDKSKISQIQIYLNDFSKLQEKLNPIKKILPFFKSESESSSATKSTAEGSSSSASAAPHWFQSLLESIQNCASSALSSSSSDKIIQTIQPKQGKSIQPIPELSNVSETEDQSTKEKGAGHAKENAKNSEESSSESLELEKMKSEAPAAAAPPAPAPAPKGDDGIKVVDVPAGMRKNPIVNWLTRAFTNVTGFFKNAFTHAKHSLKGLTDKFKRKAGPGEETPKVRNRRLAPAGGMDWADLLNGILNPSDQKRAGRLMLKQLLRDAFRVYGHSCPNLSALNIQSFRVSAKAFMNFVRESEQIAFVVGSILDKQLVEAIRQCQREVVLKKK